MRHLVVRKTPEAMLGRFCFVVVVVVWCLLLILSLSLSEFLLRCMSRHASAYVLRASKLGQISRQEAARCRRVCFCPSSIHHRLCPREKKRKQCSIVRFTICCFCVALPVNEALVDKKFGEYVRAYYKEGIVKARCCCRNESCLNRCV